MTERAPIDRNVKLDALRGLCALIVVFFHASMAVPGVNAALSSLPVLRPFIAGPSAVFVFFAMSGYVLQIAFVERGGGHVASFLLRRFARIYPPVAAALLTSLALYLLVRPDPALPVSAWAQRFWGHPLLLQSVLDPLLLIFRNFDLNPPLWSIVIELRYSIGFPLIAAAVTRWPIWAAYTAFLIGLCVDILWPQGSDLRFLVLFAGGAAMAHGRAMLASRLSRVPIAWQRAALLVAIALLCFDQETAHGVPVHAGALLLVALVALTPARATWASLAPVRWLGRVSYSLYLIHLPVMLATAYACGHIMPLWLAIALGIPLGLLAAEVFYRLVEKPAIRFGLRFAPAVRQDGDGRSKAMDVEGAISVP